MLFKTSSGLKSITNYCMHGLATTYTVKTVVSFGHYCVTVHAYIAIAIETEGPIIYS